MKQSWMCVLTVAAIAACSGSQNGSGGNTRTISEASYSVAVPREWETIKMEQDTGARSADGLTVVFFTMPKESNGMADMVSQLTDRFRADGRNEPTKEDLRLNGNRATRLVYNIPGRDNYLSRYWLMAERSRSVATVVCGEYETQNEGLPAACAQIFSTLEWVNVDSRPPGHMRPVGTQRFSVLIPEDWTSHEENDDGTAITVFDAPRGSEYKGFVFALGTQLTDATLAAQAQATAAHLSSVVSPPEAYSAGTNRGYIFRTRELKGSTAAVQQSYTLVEQSLGMGILLCTAPEGVSLTPCHELAASFRITQTPAP